MNHTVGQRALQGERTAKEQYSVLLVDDSDDDRLFMRRAIETTTRLELIGELSDGEAAIEYLDGQKRFRDRQRHPFPDVVLLDLKMPRKTGHEVLEWIRAKRLGGLFVAVVSGSFLEEDVERSMELGAHAYFKKAALREELQAMINQITEMLDTACARK